MKKISSVVKTIPLSKRSLEFVELAGELVENPLDETKSLGFMSRLLVMVNLPYRNPGKETLGWWRENGRVVLDVTPGRRKGKSLGLPYGSYPRLILAYLVNQAVKTQSPVIFLGKSFGEFLRLLEIEKGGKQYHQLQKQLERTLSASFSWTYENEKMWSRTNIQVSHQSQLWWDPKSPDQQALWESRIELNHHFFKEIIRHPVPLDLRVLKLFKNSPLGLDLYMFLSWRIFNLKKPLCISWKNLRNQLGGQYTDLKEFARDCRKHIKRIQAIWPELNIEAAKGRLYVFSTSRTLVPVKKNGD